MVDDAAVVDAGYARLVLEIDRSLEPLSGRVLVDGSAERLFSGWIQLAGAIESALALAPAAEPPGVELERHSSPARPRQGTRAADR